MKFPTVTIPDPAAVGKWLDEELGTKNGSHRPLYAISGDYIVNHWFKPGDYVTAIGLTPELLLADIRRQLAESDPLAKLRKDAEAAGFSLVANVKEHAPPLAGAHVETGGEG